MGCGQISLSFVWGDTVGRIVSATHLSWADDGSEPGGLGPVQGATLPWFEVSGTTVTLHAGRDGWTGVFSITGDTLAHSDSHTASDRFVTLSGQGGTARVTRDLMEGLAENTDTGTGVYGGQTYFSGGSGLMADAGQVLVTQQGGDTFVVASMPGQSGLSGFRYDPASGAQFTDAQNDNGRLLLADPVGLASVVQGGTTYVFAASASEPGITTLRVSNSGDLVPIGNLLPEDGLWVSNISTLTATTAGGQPFVLVGAAGSGSVSVLEVGANGSLSVVDHVLDDRNTRFDDITVLETLVVGARTYVAVSGGDEGVSLFTLLPNGQLLHLETLADTQTLGLGSISALSLSEQDGDIHLIASSEVETGLTHIVYEPGTGALRVGTDGANSLTGTAADDILLDGGGADVLTGGAGADLFVLAEDGARDTIMDFQIGVDRIDVSAWGGLYSTLQLEVRSLSYGIDIRYGDERIILRTEDGASLDLDDLLETDVLGIARLTPYAERAENQPERIGSDIGDRIEGTADDNILRGMDGDDQLMGMDGDDTLDGGAGRDALRGGLGDDSLLGGGSHDALHGGGGNDRLRGGTGADSLYGEGGNDALWGDSSTDLLYGGTGNDTLTGGTGADTLYGGDGNDSLLSNTGVDLIYGGAGHDWISPGNGVDVVYGDAGNDTIIGRTGWDTLHGGTGQDSMFGSEGRDALYGDAGHDFLSGGFGWDSLWGGTGNDAIYGNIGADMLYGEDGQDRLFGATGDDYLAGGAGNDELFGAQGRDTLIGGEGNDFLRGGTLGDTFIFEQGHDRDTVSNLEWLDQLHLSTDLTDGLTDARDIVARFETTYEGDVALSFGGGDMIVFDTAVTSAELIDVIYTF